MDRFGDSADRSQSGARPQCISVRQVSGRGIRRQADRELSVVTNRNPSRQRQCGSRGRPGGPDNWKQGLSATHLDVHKVDDISDAFCSHILHGLGSLTDTLKQGSVPKDQRPWVMWEVELWARRVATLKGGNIGFYRFHASKAAE